MPKNPVTDPITDQEMAFAHLILSGTMTDRRAAEAVGLNPETAAYTKSKPRVRVYMIEHRAAVRERLVDQEAEGLRKLNLSRDQIHSSRLIKSKGVLLYGCCADSPAFRRMSAMFASLSIMIQLIASEHLCAHRLARRF